TMTILGLAIAEQQALLTTPLTTFNYLNDPFPHTASLILTLGLIYTTTKQSHRNLFKLQQSDYALQIATTQLQQETDRREEAQQALATNQHRLQTLLQDTPLIIWSLNNKGVFTYLQGAQLFSSLIGQSIFEHFNTQIPNLQNLFTLALHGELRQYTVEVNSKTFECWFAPLTHENEQVIGLIGTATDISGRQQLEEILRQSQKLESLGVLAGGIAHDFNNLLVALLGQTALAAAKLPPNNPARTHIEKANQAAERAADLTRQLLAYSGKGQFIMKPLNLNALIEENLHLFEVAIPNNVSLHHHFAKNLPLIEADTGQMQQVIMNLLLNAAEAIGEQPGIITVVTSTRVVTEVEHKYRYHTGTPLLPGRYVVLEVHDTGHGMDELVQKRIFDPFFTTKATGRGLGLAAVMGIVRGHKGGVQVYSEKGKGTSFKLLFPIAETEESVAETAVFFPPLSHPSTNFVLIIDDDDIVLEAIADILQTANINYFTANNGHTALELFRQHSHQISLVLLDLALPGMSSEEIFHALRQEKPTISIILSSGYNEVEATRRFVGKGLAGFLQKPYELTQLLEVVRTYLESNH
ncbi:MAG: PAS domain-containing sensor histidine kinase, partial [Chloroflexi bacterium]